MRKTQRKTTAKASKDAAVMVRVSGDEKRALSEAADRDGLSLSTWIRQLALRAAGVLQASV